MRRLCYDFVGDLLTGRVQQTPAPCSSHPRHVIQLSSGGRRLSGEQPESVVSLVKVPFDRADAGSPSQRYQSVQQHIRAGVCSTQWIQTSCTVRTPIHLFDWTHQARVNRVPTDSGCDGVATATLIVRRSSTRPVRWALAEFGFVWVFAVRSEASFASRATTPSSRLCHHWFQDVCCPRSYPGRFDELHALWLRCLALPLPPCCGGGRRLLVGSGRLPRRGAARAARRRGLLLARPLRWGTPAVAVVSRGRRQTVENKLRHLTGASNTETRSLLAARTRGQRAQRARARTSVAMRSGSPFLRRFGASESLSSQP